MAKLLHIIKSARVSQWVKNLALFAPIVFSGFLFVDGAFTRVFAAFLIFSFMTSGVYLLNDVVDAKKDREHPVKKYRPIASGKLPIYQAIFLFIVLVFVSLFMAYQLSTFFFISLLAYFLLNLGYSLIWKNIPVIDVISIAAGFVLRVYAGAFVIDVHMDVWFLLTVVSASLFLAAGKRRSEMTLLTGMGKDLSKHRKTLVHYTPQLLDSYVTMFANATWISYALFSFLQPPVTPEGRVLRIFVLLPRTLINSKWMMLSVPLVIYVVMRYLLLVYEKNRGESPHRVLMSDKPILLAVSAWVGMVVSILYLL